MPTARRFQFSRPRKWPELVFHVLAHVRGTAHLPASVYDVVYTAFVAAHSGPASERPLGEDARLLAAAFPDHASLSRAQLTAQLFDSADTAQAEATTDLEALASAPPDIIAGLAAISSGVELLRCAALLELPTVDALPIANVNEASLRQALSAVVSASPTLPRYTFVPIVALRQRGRLMGDEIWFGVPCDALELSPNHVAWQAAHEATVGEVAAAVGAAVPPARDVDERQIEHVAVVLLTERAAGAGLVREHADWLAHFGEIPAPNREALPEQSRALLERLLSSSDADA